MAPLEQNTTENRISADEYGFIGKIPIRNIWLLMLYASDLFRNAESNEIKFDELPDDLPGLIAQILAHAVEKRQRRRLSFGYYTRSGPLNRVRGKIDILQTERHQLLSRGRINSMNFRLILQEKDTFV